LRERLYFSLSVVTFDDRNEFTALCLPLRQLEGIPLCAVVALRAFLAKPRTATSTVRAAHGWRDVLLRAVRKAMRVAAENGFGDATARDMLRGEAVFSWLIA